MGSVRRKVEISQDAGWVFNEIERPVFYVQVLAS